MNASDSGGVQVCRGNGPARKRTYRDVAAAHGVSIGWIAKQIARYRAGGYDAIGTRSRAARTTRNRTSSGIEDVIGTNRSVTLRYKTTMRHIAIGRHDRGTRVIILQSGRDVRIINAAGGLLRHVTLEDNKLYYGTGRPPGPPKGRPLGKKKRATE